MTFALAGVGEQADRERRAALRRMKAGAGALLLVAAVAYVVARRLDGHGTWVGYLETAAEAGMVGGLADWFAVTALFRRPLGLPIPHTALIPTRKDAIGRSLADFVGANFLSAEVVGDRIRQADVAGLAGQFLTVPGRAELLTGELAAVARGALGVLRDDDVQAVLEQSLRQRLAGIRVGPPIGRLLERVVTDGAHARLVDIAVDRAQGWLRDNRDTVVALIADLGPSWAPKFLDRRVAGRVHAELVRLAGEIAADPGHPARVAADRMIASLATDLRTHPPTMDRADAAVAALLDRPAVRAAVADLAGAGRALVLELIDDPGSELRRRTAGALQAFGERLAADGALRDKLNEWLVAAAGHVVTNYRSEIARTVSDTVQRWDAAETTRKIELQVGRDLQFIRINGTVVGALAGLVIHAVGLLL